MNLLDFIFPRRCVSCGKLGRYFCLKCVGKIDSRIPTICPVCDRPSISGFTHARCQTKYTLDARISFFYYEGIIKDGIKALKYRFVSDLAHDLINFIPQDSLSLIPKSSVLVPIPLHSSRMRFRGFNQTEILGKFLAKRLGISVNTEAIKRIRKTLPQVEKKDRKERIKNIEGVFAVNNSAIKQCSNTTILLFDDVFTTGATLRSAANVLKRAGVKKVWGVVMAHG